MSRLARFDALFTRASAARPRLRDAPNPVVGRCRGCRRRDVHDRLAQARRHPGRPSRCRGCMPSRAGCWPITGAASAGASGWPPCCASMTSRPRCVPARTTTDPPSPPSAPCHRPTRRSCASSPGRSSATRPIAAVLGITPNAVAIRLHRARAFADVFAGCPEISGRQPDID